MYLPFMRKLLMQKLCFPTNGLDFYQSEPIVFSTIDVTIISNNRKLIWTVKCIDRPFTYHLLEHMDVIEGFPFMKTTPVHILS